MAGNVRIDQTGGSDIRMSQNLNIARQTPKTDFGDRVQNGISAAGGVVASGLSVAAPLIPGGGIISAAVNGISSVSNAASGVQTFGGPSMVGGTGGLSTTVPGAGGGVGGGSLGGGLGGVGDGSTPTMPSGLSGNPLSGQYGSMNSGLSENAADLGNMLKVQMQIQRENQVFTTVSNVLKTRHDTVKNTISNVR